MLKKDKKFTFDIIICSFGRLGTGLITLLLLPFYLPLLGKEAFGLFGFFLTVEVFFRILEGGLGSVIVKDFSVKIEKRDNPLQLLRSFEAAYFILGVIQTTLCLLAISLGGFKFLNPTEMSHGMMQTCLVVMAFRFMFSSLTIVHDAYIQAHEKMVALNGFRLAFSLSSSAGSILILNLANGDPKAFFIWWLLCTIIISAAKCYYCWRSNLGELLTEKPNFQLLSKYKYDQLKLIGIGFLTFLSTKYPMWIVASKLDLATVGIFALASQVTQTLSSTVAVMTKPLIARYARDEIKDNSGSQILLRMTQVMLIVAGFLVITFSLLSKDLITLWMRNKSFDPELVGLVASLLLGATFFSLVSRPFDSALQADRDFKIVYIKQFLRMGLGIPICLLASKYYGLLGIASTHLIITGIISVIIFPFMMNKYRGENMAIKKLTLPIISLVASAIIVTSINSVLVAIEPLVRSAIIVTISGCLFLMICYGGLKIIKKQQCLSLI